MSNWVSIWVWPRVSDRLRAQDAINEAFWAAVALAGLTGVFAALSLMGLADLDLGTSAFLDSAIFAGVAVGIRRRSRAAAITGLVIYGLGRMYVWFGLGRFRIAIYQYILILAFVNGVRGTFAYRKLPPKPANLVPRQN